MLNYIWAGLIVFSLGFALWGDVSDLRADRYRNRADLPVSLKLAKEYDPGAASIPAEVSIAPDAFARVYGMSVPLPLAYAGTLVQVGGERQIRFAKALDLPRPLSTIRDIVGVDKELVGRVSSLQVDGTTAEATIRFRPVYFVKLRAIASAATDFAQKAVEVAIGLIGVLSLWLGLMRIAEKSGLIDLLVRLIQPILHPLFPEVPKGHPALGLVALNLSASMLGLGNAATPFGLKAMEELQKLNRSDDTATNPMVMLLALNTAMTQFVPPAGLVALMGLEVARIYFPILLVTAMCLVISVTTAKLVGRLPVFARTNPDLLPPKTTA